MPHNVTVISKPPILRGMKTQKIHLLDALQAQQIAAGEVVERPANIVKELLENSIDAGATVITIIIEKAGKKLISISDNGSGMNRHDAELCFARHATSKIVSVDQLNALETFGFRGEALASIAAVGLVTLTTKEHTEPLLGTQVIYTHGVHTSTTAIACPPGTTIRISNLFDTLPVRKTFLKQDETEWHAIQSVVHGMALTHQSITFTVVKDGETVITAPTVSQLTDRITQLWNHNLTAQLTPINYTARGITITGLISRPPYARYNKDLIMFWVNNRLVKNSDITRSITKGYLQSLPIGKYPAAFIAIDLDKSSVDVNIHPRKEEVRFTHPGVVATCIQDAVTQTLEQSVTSRLQPIITAHHYSDAQLPPTRTMPLPFIAPHTEPVFPVSSNQPLLMPISPPPAHSMHTTTATAAAYEQHQVVAPDREAFTIIGQLFKTYILIESNDELIMIDQHAAHERILYHEYTTRFTGKEGTNLLFPETITLPSPGAVNALISVTDFFNDQGITIVQTGPQQITITTAPPQLQKEGLGSILSDAADFVLTHEALDTVSFRQKLNEHVHSHLACKMAVKAGDILTTTTMHQLVAALLATPNRFMCVHGRPTMWPISKAECEKRFKRR